MAWFTEDELRVLAGAKSFARGEGYLDAVANLRPVPGGFAATVYGNEPYEVRLLGAEGEGLSGTCDCPMGEGGAFCKHLVAVGLVLLADPERELDDAGEAEGAEEAPATRPRRRQGHDRLKQLEQEEQALKAWLGALDRAELVDLVVEHARWDETLHRKLMLRMARQPAGGSGPDVAALRRQVNTALRARGFIDYHGSHDYVRRAEEVLGVLEELLDRGHAPLVVPLAQRALELIVKATQQMDTSSGAPGEVCQRALELHARACAEAPPDPVTLAHWLVDLEVEGPGWPEVDLAAYRDGLGEAGVAAYRARVEELWAALPPNPRTPGSPAMHLYTDDDHRRWVLNHMMEALAELDGDVDRLVAVMAADLSSGWQYLRIATALRAAGRAAEALEWAERGLAAGANHRDPRLVDYVVQEYLRAGRFAEAIGLRREALERSPSQPAYEALRAAAEAAGQWPAERAWALALLRKQAASGTGALAHNTLLRALLAEGETDAAWAAATAPGAPGCTDDLWLALAEQRAATHPADAIGVFQRLAEQQIELRDKRGYRQAADLLLKLREFHDRLDQGAAFSAYLAGLKARHKPKRNLIAELARRGL